jgi:hypothetical protein
LNSADSLEITTDIENRIAEMFNEILARDSKQVVVEAGCAIRNKQMGTVRILLRLMKRDAQNRRRPV